MDVPTMKPPGHVPWVSQSFPQLTLLLLPELISLKLAWMCLHTTQSRFWLLEDTLCHFLLGSFFDVFKTESICGQILRCRQQTPTKPNLSETFSL